MILSLKKATRAKSTFLQQGGCLQNPSRRRKEGYCIRTLQAVYSQIAEGPRIEIHGRFTAKRILWDSQTQISTCKPLCCGPSFRLTSATRREAHAHGRRRPRREENQQRGGLGRVHVLCQGWPCSAVSRGTKKKPKPHFAGSTTLGRSGKAKRDALSKRGLFAPFASAKDWLETSRDNVSRSDYVQHLLGCGYSVGVKFFWHARSMLPAGIAFQLWGGGGEGFRGHPVEILNLAGPKSHTCKQLCDCHGNYLCRDW